MRVLKTTALVLLLYGFGFFTAVGYITWVHWNDLVISNQDWSQVVRYVSALESAVRQCEETHQTFK